MHMSASQSTSFGLWTSIPHRASLFQRTSLQIITKQQNHTIADHQHHNKLLASHNIRSTSNIHHTIIKYHHHTLHHRKISPPKANTIAKYQYHTLVIVPTKILKRRQILGDDYVPLGVMTKQPELVLACSREIFEQYKCLEVFVGALNSRTTTNITRFESINNKQFLRTIMVLYQIQKQRG